MLKRCITYKDGDKPDFTGCGPDVPCALEHYTWLNGIRTGWVDEDKFFYPRDFSLYASQSDDDEQEALENMMPGSPYEQRRIRPIN